MSHDREPITNLSVLVEGTYESSPVTLFNTKGEPDEYPLIQLLASGLDVEQLTADYYFLRDKLSTSYINDRKNNLGRADAIHILHGAGFTPTSYVSQGLMVPGTNKLMDIVPSYTRSVLSSLPGNSYRAHYSIARPGWKSTFHGDAHHFRDTGFRVNLPITKSAHYTFQVDGRTEQFELALGSAWFVNFCRIHQGFNPSANEDRVCLIFQLDSDLWLNSAPQSTNAK